MSNPWEQDSRRFLVSMDLRPGSLVVYTDLDGREITATLQEGPCSAGPEYVHITWPGYSSVVHPRSLRKVFP